MSGCQDTTANLLPVLGGSAGHSEAEAVYKPGIVNVYGYQFKVVSLSKCCSTCLSDTSF